MGFYEQGCMTDANVLAELQIEDPHQVTTDSDDLITKITFDPAEYKVMENCGSVEIQVKRG